MLQRNINNTILEAKLNSLNIILLYSHANMTKLFVLHIHNHQILLPSSLINKFI